MAALIGVLAIRTRGIYFSMVTLALAQCVYYVFYQADGLDRRRERPARRQRRHDHRPVRPAAQLPRPADTLLRDRGVRHRRAVVAVAHPGLAVRRGDRGGARERGARAGLRLRRRAHAAVTFMLSGAFCGLAGALQALHLSIVPIEILHYETSGMVVMMALLGGMGTFFGPFVGAAVFLLLEDVVSLWTVHWQFVRRRGLRAVRAVLSRAESGARCCTAHGKPEMSAAHQRRGHPAHRRPSARRSAASPRCEDIIGRLSPRRHHLDHRPERRRQEHLFNLLSGAFAPTTGSVIFEGRDVTGLPQHRFAHLGIAKSFQITNVFPQLTAHENVRVAAQALRVALRHLARRARALTRAHREGRCSCCAPSACRQARATGRHAGAWRAARARDRDGAGEPAAAAAARRADRRHVPGRNPHHDGPDRAARRASAPSSWSSTR